MPRYTKILSATFGSGPLELPMSLKLVRSAQPQPAAGDGQHFIASVEIARPIVLAELRIRGIASAEAMSLGQRDHLAVTLGPATAGEPNRKVSLRRAVLLAVELDYQQTAAASALLRFAAEANDDDTDPYESQESQEQP
jgi:hypothetical protein